MKPVLGRPAEVQAMKYKALCSGTSARRQLNEWVRGVAHLLNVLVSPRTRHNGGATASVHNLSVLNDSVSYLAQGTLLRALGSTL